jgi:hypothetical protein
MMSRPSSQLIEDCRSCSTIAALSPGRIEGTCQVRIVTSGAWLETITFDLASSTCVTSLRDRLSCWYRRHRCNHTMSREFKTARKKVEERDASFTRCGASRETRVHESMNDRTDHSSLNIHFGTSANTKHIVKFGETLWYSLMLGLYRNCVCAFFMSSSLSPHRFSFLLVYFHLQTMTGTVRINMRACELPRADFLLEKQIKLSICPALRLG